ncbi:hemagglutinin repeat-containing protein, partial [Pseudomonas brassicacearum]|uniref:hemagglutinin repeat-containing protein n=1 Tax=Pseudomonas brassicacearum TaxID=930166 RepID=UPI001E37E41D
NLTANVGQLNNSSGELNSLSNVTLRVASLDNVAGLVVAGQMLDINASGQVNNRGGRLTASKSAELSAGSLDNRQGSLSAQQGLNLNLTGQLLNAQGSVTSSDTLQLKAGQVDNTAGRIASAKALDASVTGLDQQNGELFSNTSLSLDMNQGQLNNQGGLINASGALLLNNLKDVNNQNGEISSKQAFTLAAQNLDNSDGKLLSNQGLMLRIAQVLDNARGAISAASVDSHSNSLDNSEGLISSRDRLDLIVDALLDNQRGSLIADGALLLVADRLDNRVGEIVGKTGLNATVNTVDNRQGTLISTDALKLTATSLDNRQAGLIGATKGLDLDVDDLDNRGGELSSNADVTLVSQYLDNSDGGQVFAGQALKLTVDQLLNRTKGLLSAKAGLELDGGALDNSGGYLISQQNQRINLSRDLLNSQGQLSSEGSLSVSAANLTNTGGSLSSAKDLTVRSLGRLDNQGGELVADGGLLLTSGALDNRQQGHISAKGAVGVTTGAYDNSQNGRLNSASTLNLVAGQVTNQDGGAIGSQGALTASVKGLDQQGGKLFSNTSLSLDMNNGQLNNQSGLINAPGTLLLKNLSGVNNQGGEISSAEAFTLAAQNLTNDNGKLLSSQGLTLRIAQALNNVKGMIGAATVDAQAQSLNNNGGTLTSRGNLVLTVDQQLDNQAQGLISAAQLLTLKSSNLNNQGGSVVAGGALVLNAMALNNSANGLINAQGDLTLDADSLDSSDGGEVSAKGDINLTLASLTQDGGRLLGEKAVTLNLGNGDLNNRNGLIIAKGPLTFNAVRDLSNQGGEISSSQSFDLKGRTLDNSGGKLISSQNLGLDGQALVNQNGLISGWQGLLVNGTSLDNRNNGTLSSRNGNVTLNLLGNLLNGNGGALVSQGSLGVTAASVDNSKGILSSGGAQNLNLSGALVNSQGGLIDGGAGLTIKATSVANVSGAVNAQQTLTLDANDVNNRQGTLVGNADVNLNLNGVLDNSAAKLASAGPLTVKGATAINNQGGQIASQDQMTLLTGSLDNSNAGTIAAKNALAITATGAVQNHTNGLIYSQTADIELDAVSLANGKGEMQGQTGLDLQFSGDLDNQGGKLIAQTGDVSVTAANIDNRGGTLAAIKGALEARTVGVLRNGFDVNNKGGVIQAQRLNLRALAGLNNNGGRIAAQAGDVIINTADLNNRNGGLYATGLVNISATDLDNGAGGQLAGGSLDFSLRGALSNVGGVLESDSRISLSAASLNNQGGQLRTLASSGSTRLQVTGVLDNSNGVMEVANQDLTLQAGSFLNTGGRLLHGGTGEFQIDLANLGSAGGDIVTLGGLTLSAANWTNSSVIQAARLNIDVGQLTLTGSGQLLATDSLVGRGGNWTNNGLIASNGTLDMALTGLYAGSGQVTSVGNLGLSAAGIQISSAGRIAGASDVQVRAGGTLVNQGRITSARDLTLNAANLSNSGTIGSAGKLDLVSQVLRNEGADAGNQSLISSGGDMRLLVGDFTNRFATVYSLGGLLVAGDAALNRANRIDNVSATLQSGGAMGLYASTVSNRKDAFSVSEQLVSGTITYQCLNCKGRHYDFFYYLTEEIVRSVQADSAAASINAGAALKVQSSLFENKHSTVSAGSSIDISADNFNNEGASTESVLRTRQFRNPNDSERSSVWDSLTREGGAIAEYAKYNSKTQFVYQEEWYDVDGSYITPVAQSKQDTGIANPNYRPNSGYAVPSKLLGYTLIDTRETQTNTGVAANAVIQAGGAVNITASQTLGNGVTRQNTGYSSQSLSTANTQASSVVNPNTARINAQLPPDLAQRQVNPLDLPGFVLPTGGSGLFRLSALAAGQANTSGVAPSPANWTLGGASIGLTQRQQPLEQTGPTQLSGGNGPIFQPGASAVLPQVLPAAAQGVPSTATVINPQSIARVQGLPLNSRGPQPHKYLVETDPALADLKQFMSSDYLLDKLGYDSDASWKRLGDGYFEQQMIQQAVTARTGKRFIDGQTSDEALYRYLMDNAIASKQQLGLSVGVTLTGSQVAALTHDIVWLEEHEVMGEKVLVPVLYLAHANDRLAPTGALIEGQDVNLIAGQNLENSGTLRAKNNLSASAGQDLANSGLIQAGGRVDLLAGNTLFNGAGGIINGRDVSLNSLLGDVVNERTQTLQKGGYVVEGKLDSAARIEASNDLIAGVGRDLLNIGGVMLAGRDLEIRTGRDLLIGSAEQTYSYQNGTRNRSESIKQSGSQITAGRDLDMGAGRDFAAIGSNLEAKRNIAVDAVGDVTLASAADEEHSYSKSKKVTRQEDHVRQVGTQLKAGGDVSMTAGEDIRLISSRVSAGDEAYLYAGDQLELIAETDSDYSLYQKKSKGSWGKKKTKRDEVTDVRHVGSAITTGGDLTLESGGDQRYQAAKLDSGNDLTVSSGGDIVFEGVKDLHQESHEKSKSSAAWFSMKGKGRTDETLRQSELTAQGDLVINAVGKIHADVRQVNKQTVSASIDAMVQADPKLAWLKELDAQGGVDWRQVQEVHTSFKYANSGLGPAAQMVIAILMTVMLGPAGAGLGGWALAGASSLATTGTVATINNKGDIGAGYKAVLSKDGLTNAAIAAITAGIAENYLGDMTMTKQVNGKTVIDLSSIEAVSHFAGQQLINNASAAAIAKAFGRDVTLAGILQSTIYSTLAAYSFDQVGNLKLKTGSPEKIALHALVGGMIAEASGSDFAVGAMAAGVNETFANQLRRMSAQMDPQNRDHLMLMSSQLLGVVAAAAVAGDDANSLQTGSYVAGNATQYNNLNHHDMSDFVGDMNACGSSEICQKNTWDGGKYEEISNEITDWSEKAVSGAFAKSLLTSIQGGLTALNDLNCTTATCTQYKDTLTERALNDLTNLAKVTDTWENATSVAALVIPTSGGARGAGAGEGGISPRIQAALDKFTEAKAIRTGASTGKNGSTPLGGPDAEAGMPYTHPVKDVPNEPIIPVPGRVQSRINIANGRTETTPLRDSGQPVSAGFEHVLEGHFNREISNSRSVFTIAPEELKGILQSTPVVKS